MQTERDIDPPWHARDKRAVLDALGAGADGLSAERAAERLARYGPNRLTPPPRRGPLLRFFLQFHNVLIYVLIGAAAVTAGLGHWVDTGVILGVVVVNALIGFVQEGKAERALEAIKDMLAPRAVVVRDGHPVTVPAEAVVPGDVVLLAPGDRVPADLRLLEAHSLRIDEAMLTGESLAVEKGTAPVAADAVIGDRSPMAYAGTLVTYGQGRGVVVATGDATEIGRISAMLRDVTTLQTPLLVQMDRFARWLTAAILVIATLTFAFGVLVHGDPPAEMFLAAVGLAVAAIPEGLPAIMTITLALGVQRMARRNAIIRRLPAVETLGSVTVICSDKTGTLTRNEMTVQTVVCAEYAYTVTGVGYEPRGCFMLDGREISLGEHGDLLEAARAALACNDADLRRAAEGWLLEGDPTEGALVAMAMKAGLDPAHERERAPRTDVIPFESEHRFMATLHHDHAGHAYVCLKGAPEVVFERCNRQRRGGEDEPFDPAHWHRVVEDIAARGQRPLALAFRAVPAGKRTLRFEDVGGGLTLLAVCGLTDPPREEAIVAVRQCREAGIGVKMITGDHVLTASSVGAELGIGDGRRALSGRELEDIDDERLTALAGDVDVFARASPEHKLRLVQALQRRGEVVAMTGDGVNDAPALKRANIGIAMGRKGTEAAKEAAEMVLADDNFASIAAAVEEGRAVYDNLKKAILFILPTNGGEAFLVISAILAGRMLPITPAQILWVNMITAVTLALALAFEPPERDVMRRPPRRPDAPLLSGLLIWRILFVSAIMVAGTFVLFVWAREHGMGIEYARTVSVNALVFFEMCYLINTRHVVAPGWTREGLFGNGYALLAIATVIGFQLLFTYTPPFQAMFQTRPLPVGVWLSIIAAGTALFVLVEIEKPLAARIAARWAAARANRKGGVWT